MTDRGAVADDGRYRHRYRVRFDEAGPDGCLRASGIFRYAQDVAWMHSEARGFDRAWYAGRSLAWLVRAVAVTIDQPITMGAELDVETSVAGYRKVWARRRVEVFLAASGARAATADVDWVLVDARGTPTRIPAEFGPAFPGSPGDLALGRVELGPVPEHASVRDLVVRPHELDPNDHVNNATYVDWLDEAVLALPGGAEAIATCPRRYRVEYVAGAGPAVRLLTATWATDGGWSHRLYREDGTELARARLER